MLKDKEFWIELAGGIVLAALGYVCTVLAFCL